MREIASGRLIRVKCDSTAVTYIVALPDPTAAIDLIRTKVGGSDDQVRDVARVSDHLLKYLHLQSGEFMRADDARPFGHRAPPVC